MNVVPHILLQKKDIIKIPGGIAGLIVKVVDLIDWYLWVEHNNNRFTLPWGFYLKCEWYYIPLIHINASYFNFDNGTTYDFVN